MASQKFPVIRYNQKDTSYLSLILPFSVLDAASEVKVYAVDEDGYQRQPNPVHYNKIKSAALNPDIDFKLPTSIILGADIEVIEKFLTVDEHGHVTLEIPSDLKLFRIVDGQHRVFGLREAAKKEEEYNSFSLSVVILLTPENKRSIELEIFTDINSKSKRINTDLAELAKFDYQIKENRIKLNEINRHIGIKTAYHLKTDFKDSVWHYGIKFDIHSENALGIIGVTIFSESIEKVIERYLLDHPEYKTLAGQPLIEYCSTAAKEVSLFVNAIWNDLVKVKWAGAFKEDIVRSEEGEIVKVYYNKNYYIQKGLGIKSINPLIGDVVRDQGMNQASIDLLKNIILGSKVRIEHWQNGGPFSGFNSESGFKKIKDYIQGDGLSLFI
ncbi:DGQHR domain-containing protein [Pedobacter punctiformis]|uniref:DGQHR domain-containing protein n=1 Tax=Pedobacter punctiformis TaxID=3004097 RepID=A0ABT4LC20_9SPHI|nr:DGQHR domain-containing protein [Pedobacter sp. HCMS5-2]MCZ4245466.1 DGQHR domain-containing protein [Pedobacter sp. HCMS5-2]